VVSPTSLLLTGNVRMVVLGDPPRAPSAGLVIAAEESHLTSFASAPRLKTRLLFEPGVVVTSVPWQLASTEGEDLAQVAG
jgi:hypothetical protein